MKHPVIGFAMCGSFCTFAPVLEALEELHTVFPDIIPIMSDTSYETDSRFGDASSFRERLEAISSLPARETRLRSSQTASPTRPSPSPPRRIFETKLPL